MTENQGDATVGPRRRPRPYPAIVDAVEPLGPFLLRVSLGGGGLAGFRWPGVTGAPVKPTIPTTTTARTLPDDRLTAERPARRHRPRLGQSFPQPQHAWKTLPNPARAGRAI